MSETKLEEDRHQLRLSLDDTENQLTKTEVLRQSLEGDIERLKLVVNDKEAENQLLSCRAENLRRQVYELDDKTQSLTTTVERLNLNLARTEQQDTEHKNQVVMHNMYNCSYTGCAKNTTAAFDCSCLCNA